MADQLGARPPLPGELPVTTAAPRMSAQGVLDTHADLHDTLGRARRERLLRAVFEDYGRRETAGYPQWQASHLHPATDIRDLSPWLASLSDDLSLANTYQVTPEMVDLATAMMETTPDLSDIREEDLPSDSGFMWLDKPIPRPSVEDDAEHPPLLMHAVSWCRVGPVPITLNAEAKGVAEASGIPVGSTASIPVHTDGQAVSIPATAMPGQQPGVYTGYVEAVRIREWAWNDDRNVIPRPLHLMGQSLLVLTDHVHTPLPELQLVHMLWILMQMEITAATPVRPNRAGRKRAAALRPDPEVKVITLRRPAHGEKPVVGHQHVDWSCSWLVRGHWRHAPHGGHYADGRTRTWIKPYIKGPDGMPLRSVDILWKLAR